MIQENQRTPATVDATLALFIGGFVVLDGFSMLGLAVHFRSPGIWPAHAAIVLGAFLIVHSAHKIKSSAAAKMR